MTIFSGFYDAYKFLEEHHIFENKYKFVDFQSALIINVVKVNPTTEKIDNDASKNTETRVWLECGPYETSKEYFGYKHDIELDTGGATFEEAIINLADLVFEKYGTNPDGYDDMLDLAEK